MSAFFNQFWSVYFGMLGTKSVFLRPQFLFLIPALGALGARFTTGHWEI